MKYPEETRREGRWDRIFVCRDDHIIQAIALVYADCHGYCDLSHLVTAPWNVRSSVNQAEVKRVEGAGTTIIRHLAATLPDFCQGISVICENSSKPFYEKLKFKVTKEFRRYTQDGFEMVLDKIEIEKLFPKKVA
jgi:hypothetical protein